MYAKPTVPRGSIIAVELHGLQCDNPRCNYHDDTAKIEDNEELLERLCPYCGDRLLTPEDLLVAIRYLVMARWINRWFGWLDYVFHPRGRGPRDTKTINVERVANGKTRLVAVKENHHG